MVTQDPKRSSRAMPNLQVHSKPSQKSNQTSTPDTQPCTPETQPRPDCQPYDYHKCPVALHGTPHPEQQDCPNFKCRQKEKRSRHQRHAICRSRAATLQQPCFKALTAPNPAFKRRSYDAANPNHHCCMPQAVLRRWLPCRRCHLQQPSSWHALLPLCTTMYRR